MEGLEPRSFSIAWIGSLGSGAMASACSRSSCQVKRENMSTRNINVLDSTQLWSCDGHMTMNISIATTHLMGWTNFLCRNVDDWLSKHYDIRVFIDSKFSLSSLHCTGTKEEIPKSDNIHLFKVFTVISLYLNFLNASSIYGLMAERAAFSSSNYATIIITVN